MNINHNGDMRSYIHQNKDIKRVRDVSFLGVVILLGVVIYWAPTLFGIGEMFYRLLIQFAGICTMVIALWLMISKNQPLKYAPTNAALIRGNVAFRLTDDSAVLSIVNGQLEASKPCPEHDKYGGVRVDYLLSADGSFLALSASRYNVLSWENATDVRVYNGEQAEQLSRYLGLK